MIKSEAAIYEILEDLLRKAGDKPQTCVDLFEHPQVRKHADNPNRVSDYLGHMWRRGLIQRWYAAKDLKQRTRYAYTWIDQEETAPEPVERLTVVRNTKPNVTVTEGDGEIVLDFNEFTITVKRK